jgi:ACS family D-galactonate transporter-like MFS transporter
MSTTYLSTGDLARAKPTTVRWRIFAIVFVLVVFNLIDRTALSIAMPTISREFELSPTMQGVVLSSFFWTYALLQVPGGWLIDRYGPRRLIAGATIGWGIFQSLAAVATGGVSLVLTRLGLGIAEAPLFPAGAKLNAIWLSPQERGRGAVFMDSGSPLGAAFGGAIIAFLILLFESWRLAFLAAGLATIAVGLLAWYYLRDDPAAHPGVNEAERVHIMARAEGAAPAEVAPERIAPRSLFGLLVGRMSWAMINFGLLTWGPSYLAQARGFDLKQMGYATFVIFMAGMAGSLFAGFLADWLFARGWTRAVVYRAMLGLSGFAIFATFVALPQVADPIGAVALLSVTLFFVYWGSLYWSLPPLLAPCDKVGLLGGTMNFAGSSSGIAVPIITGLILQATGAYVAVLMFFAGCALLYVVGTMLIAFPSRRGL